MFDQENNQKLSFCEFLQGIATFTKFTEDQKIEKLFQIYDNNNEGFIDKKEFLKMLYNYPKENLDELFQIVELNDNNEINDKMITQVGMSFTILDSKACLLNNFNTDLKNKEFQKFKQLPSLDQQSLTKNKNINSTNQIPLPTTLNSKMKMMTNLIYQMYGSNDKMYLKEFKLWVQKHPKFLKSIEGWFRPSLWEIYKDQQTGKQQLGFNQKTPNLKAFEQTKRSNHLTKKKSFIHVYDEFLFVFFDKMKSIPDKLYLLKGLDINFDDTKLKIIIDQQIKTKNDYRGLTIYFQENNIYDEWKKYFQRFEKDYNIHKYNIIQKIGKGSFSIVSKIQKKGTNEIYALKYIQKSSLNQYEIEVIKNEIEIMKILNHNNIVQFYEGWEGFNSFNYIFEYIEGEDLYEYIYQNGPVNESLGRKLIGHLLGTLKTIHLSGVVHRDLKPENIMIKIEKNILYTFKLIDFGLSIFQDQLNEQSIRVGTITYMAPEILKNENYSFPIDIFAVGVIMYFILSGQLPFYAEEEEIIAKKIFENDYELNIPIFDNISIEAKDLIQKMLEPDQFKRFSIKQCIEHPWIQNQMTYENRQTQSLNNKDNEDSFDLTKFVQLNYFYLFNWLNYLYQNGLRDQLGSLLDIPNGSDKKPSLLNILYVFLSLNNTPSCQYFYPLFEGFNYDELEFLLQYQVVNTVFGAVVYQYVPISFFYPDYQSLVIKVAQFSNSFVPPVLQLQLTPLNQGY